MNISIIADAISEDIDAGPQELLNRYIEAISRVDYAGFSNCCAHQNLLMTEEMFLRLLANNQKYLFTEHEGSWLPLLLDRAELELR